MHVFDEEVDQDRRVDPSDHGDALSDAGKDVVARTSLSCSNQWRDASLSQHAGVSDEAIRAEGARACVG
jgi:hypothetical protein